MMQGECERCGVVAPLQTIEKKDKSATVKLCQRCVALVIKPGTAWQVKK